MKKALLDYVEYISGDVWSFTWLIKSLWIEFEGGHFILSVFNINFILASTLFLCLERICKYQLQQHPDKNISISFSLANPLFVL